MKKMEKPLLMAMKIAAKKQTDDPEVPGYLVVFHQPKK